MPVPESYIDYFENPLAATGASGRFGNQYCRWREGAADAVKWEEVGSPESGDIVTFDEVTAYASKAQCEKALGRTAWIVLNGGLGTSMQMKKAKSLLKVKEGLNFLDLIARHVLSIREDSGCVLPLLFMNSFATQKDTLAALEPYSDLPLEGLPLDFVQSRFPRIREADGEPFGLAGEDSSWAPPGHGDIYPSLYESGVLESLLKRGIRWAFISNADNLGATPAPQVPAYMEGNDIPFMLEVTPKTAADVKGGTLISRAGRVELLEIAQVPEGREGEFKDFSRFPYFNTNNLWIDLEALLEKLEGGNLELPLIVNRKEVDGVGVVQLESAMGAAIGSFTGARGLMVPRKRFAPVKTTDDLLVRRSDLYRQGERSPLEPIAGSGASSKPVVVELDKHYFKGVEDLELRIPEVPSLVEASALKVVGDVHFGRNVKVRGSVVIKNTGDVPMLVGDGEVLEGQR